MNIETVTVLISVERHESKWIPFTYRMCGCKQRTPNVVDWADEMVDLLRVLGGLPNLHKMVVGERRKYRVKMQMRGWVNWDGEGDCDVEILSCKRWRK